ncbi:retinol dehydrogenase 7-like [Gigantopelta aegis]|uniref:retinol dehydrogenase 7-like n=1 Tax=Gigantopelta aegis TaxID=1735272 RepID=UPI001B88CCE1|nr:retinol dehydrogenase 7-like [Gigantopelta aegis]
MLDFTVSIYSNQNVFLIAVGISIAYMVIRWLVSGLSVGHIEDKYVFITGCDSGFGNLLVKRLDAWGFHVLAACHTVKGANHLQQESSPNVKVFSPLELADEESVKKAYQFVLEHLPDNKGLWAVVNNGGCQASGVGPLEWHQRAVYERVFAVNVYGMLDVTRMLLPLVRKGQGRIVNMSSLAARFGTFGVGPYAMTKYAVEGFTDCLRVELLKQGVSVHVIEPGGFRTAFADEDNFRRLAQESFENTSPDLKRFYGGNYVEKFCDSIAQLRPVVSDDLDLVVDCYVHAVTSRFPLDRYTPGNWLAVSSLVLCWLPRWIGDTVINSTVVHPAGLIR